MTPEEIGTLLARRIFKRRGNHSEAHLSEVELAAMLTIAAEKAKQYEPSKVMIRFKGSHLGLLTLREDIEQNTGPSCYCDPPPPGEHGTIECTNCTHRRWIETLKSLETKI